MKKYILFDLDGTLTESAPGIINSVKYALAKLGITNYSPDALNKFIGPPLAESFKTLFGLQGGEITHAISVYREYFAEKGLFENEVYAGIPETLEKLKEAGLMLAVSTSKPEVYARKIMDKFGLSKYFDFICGIPLDDETMTKSAVVERTLGLMGADNKALALMVGDRSYDVAGAHKNGIECLGITYGYGDENELISAGAEYIARSPEEMCEAILKIAK